MSDGDRDWYDTSSLLHMQTALGGVLPWEKTDYSTSLYGAFLSNNNEYREMSDPDAVQLTLSHRLVEYNSSSECKMELIFFQYAVSHLTRISRILRVPRGKKNYILCICL